MNVKRDKGNLINGKWVLLATLVLLPVVVLTVAMIAHLLTQSLQRNQPPINWHDRQQWVSSPVLNVELEKVGFLNPPGTTELRDRPFALDEAEESIVKQAAALVHDEHDPRTPAVGNGNEHVPPFTSENVHTALLALVEKKPTLFYPRYLLARWHDLHDDAEASAAAYEQAMNDAPAALVMRFVDSANQPMPNFHVGTLHLRFARIHDGQLDDSLVLVYPDMTTDELGQLYLPVYRGAMRLISPPQPTGYRVNYPHSAWFECVGRIGRLPPAVVLTDHVE